MMQNADWREDQRAKKVNSKRGKERWERDRHTEKIWNAFLGSRDIDRKTKRQADGKKCFTFNTSLGSSVQKEGQQGAGGDYSGPRRGVPAARAQEGHRDVLRRIQGRVARWRWFCLMFKRPISFFCSLSLLPSFSSSVSLYLCICHLSVSLASMVVLSLLYAIPQVRFRACW